MDRPRRSVHGPVLLDITGVAPSSECCPGRRSSVGGLDELFAHRLAGISAGDLSGFVGRVGRDKKCQIDIGRYDDSAIPATVAPIMSEDAALGPIGIVHEYPAVGVVL